MLNPFSEVNWKPDIQERKKFALSLIIGFPCIALVFLLVGFLREPHVITALPLWLGGVGLSAGVIFWLLPQISKPFYLVWYSLACFMGLVIGNLIFSLVYYLVLTPIGLAMRMLGRDPLQKGFDRSAATYWKAVPENIESNQYYRQF